MSFSALLVSPDRALLPGVIVPPVLFRLYCATKNFVNLFVLMTQDKKGKKKKKEKHRKKSHRDDKEVYLVVHFVQLELLMF